MNRKIDTNDRDECNALVANGCPHVFGQRSADLITHYLAIGLKPSLVAYIVLCSQLYPASDSADATPEPALLPPEYPKKFNWIRWAQIVAEIKARFPNLALDHWRKLLEEFVGRKQTMSIAEAVEFVARLVPKTTPQHTGELA